MSSFRDRFLTCLFPFPQPIRCEPLKTYPPHPSLGRSRFLRLTSPVNRFGSSIHPISSAVVDLFCVLRSIAPSFPLVPPNRHLSSRVVTRRLKPISANHNSIVWFVFVGGLTKKKKIKHERVFLQTQACRPPNCSKQATRPSTSQAPCPRSFENGRRSTTTSTDKAREVEGLDLALRWSSGAHPNVQANLDLNFPYCCK